MYLLVIIIKMTTEIFKRQMSDVASNAIKLYIIDDLKYSKEEFEYYMENYYVLHLDTVMNDWICDIYIKIFNDDNTSLNEKINRIYSYYEELYVTHRHVFHMNDYFQDAYLEDIIDNIFNQTVYLK